MKGINLKNHFTLLSANDVNEICKPLFDIGVSYFNYLKIYKDGSRGLLTNNASWIDHFYQNALYLTAGVIDIEHLLPKGYFLWSELDLSDPAYSQGQEAFNIDHGISFIIRRKGITYLYIFASTKDNFRINNFYLRNIDLFKRFIQYFQDRGSNLIKQAESYKIFLPKRQVVNSNQNKRVDLSSDIKAAFYEKTKLDKFYLLDIADDLYLTPKQVEIAIYLVIGATAKQCARQLGISYRTVETHVEEMKQKISKYLGINLNKSELAEFFRATEIKNIAFPYNDLDFKRNIFDSSVVNTDIKI